MGTFDGYIRVSQVRGREGESFISPSQQRDRIVQWAAAYGHTIANVYEELDASGAKADRPLLLEAIGRIERGESDGTIVAKLDRFARSLIDGLSLIGRIQEAGGTFVSVADGLDLSTDTGRLVLRIMLSLAEFELDRVRGNWRDAQARAVARGIHPSAVPPFGYRRQGRGGPLLIDDVAGPLVTELFKKRAAGVGFSDLSRWLQERGAITQRGRSSWSIRALRDITRNRVYLGEASSGDVRNTDAHPALTDPDTFQLAQRPGTQFAPQSEDPSPIRTLLRCAGCRYNMRAERRQLKDCWVWYFTCKAHSGRVSWECADPAAIRDDGELERTIVAAFHAQLPKLEADSPKGSPRLDEIDRRVAHDRVAFEEFRDDTRIQQQLGMDAYLAGLASRQDTLNASIAERARVLFELGAKTLPASAVEIIAAWDDLPVTDQRDLLRSAIRCVFVRDSRRTAPLDGRLHIVWAWEPVDLPRQGLPWQPIPFLFDDTDSDPA